MIYETYSEDNTKEVGYHLGKNAKANDVICLVGDLGVGKTMITKGIAQALGVKDNVSSPTFTIVNEYEGENLGLYHFDTYRIGDPSEMYEIGFDEYLYKNGICVIEWADTIKNLIPERATWITIEKNLDKGVDYRKIEVKKAVE